MRLLRRDLFRNRRMFWQVYLHGAFLLVTVGLTLALVGQLVRQRSPWKDLPIHFANHLSAQFIAHGGDPRFLLNQPASPLTALGAETSLYRADGSLIASTGRSPLQHLGPDEVAGASHQAVRLKHSKWSAVAPLWDESGLVGYAVVSHQFDADQMFVRGAVLLFAVLSVLALASIPLAHAVASPLERLTETARALGRGELSVRTGIHQSGEVGVLAGALDDMAGRIERYVTHEREMLANISHELRTPLARIRFALDLAAEVDQASDHRYLREIETDLRELEALVEDVLTSARLDLAQSGRRDGIPALHLQTVRGERLLRDAIERFRLLHPDAPLRETIGPDLPEVDVDPGLIRRLLDNLMDNARKHGDAGQVVTLKGERRGRDLQFEIIDQGQGIPPEDLPHLFEPFFRTDRSRARETGGVGLGLTLARRIAEAHGGSITVQSSLNVGTTFTVTLPANTLGEGAASTELRAMEEKSGLGQHGYPEKS